jgi:geranylgeranyl diphosphate synthase type II
MAKKSLVDAELSAITANMVPTSMNTKDYYEALTHSVLEGGKRIRPVFTLAVYELYKKLNPAIITASCVTELIHAGSLMLDDLPCMDDAKYRRGKKSSHYQFGEYLAILASAALWVEGFRLLTELKTDKLDILVSKTATCMGGKGLIQGQLLDLAAFNSVQTSRELRECYKLKTSVLFDLAATIGAVLADADDKDQELISQFAVSFGVAYQIRDDILGAIQTFEQTGKDTKSDEKNHKPNFVSLLGVEKAKVELNKEISKALSCLDQIGRNDANLRALVGSLAVA